MDTTRRTLLRRSLAATAAFGLVATLAACGDDDADTGETGSAPTTAAAGDGGEATTTSARELEQLTVMMPFPISPNFIADMAAESGGFMAEQGIDLEVQFAQGAPQALQQLAAGNVGIVRNGPLETVIATVEQDAPFVTIGMPNQRTHYTLTSLPGETLALADLEGRTVGLPSLGGNAEFVVDLLLRGEGVDPATVQKQAVGNDASAFGALQEGLVDALFVSRSTVAAIRALGEEIEVDFLENVNPLLGTNLVTTDEFLDEHRDLVVRYLAGLHAAMTVLNDPAQRPELIATVAADDQWDLPQLDDAEAANRIIEAAAGLWFQEGEENLLRNIPERWDAGVAELVELGVLPEGTEASDFYTNEPLEEAVG